MPNFAESGLAGFEAEAGRFKDGDSVVVTTDGNVGFIYAVEGEVVDLFVGHEDLVAFVADAEKRMRASVEDNTTHKSFGLDAGGAGFGEFSAVSVFVDVEEGGFEFFG